MEHRGAIALRRFFKVFIAVFFVWQCNAVLAYSLSNVEGYPLLELIANQKKYVRPYVLITSQWQKWNLFSPDPLRRVIAMDIERQHDGAWETIETIDQHHVSTLRRANELKTIRRMEDDDDAPLQLAYINDVCRRHSISDGTAMRMRKRWFVIPKHDEIQSQEWWNAWQPDWKNRIIQTSSCNTTL